MTKQKSQVSDNGKEVPKEIVNNMHQKKEELIRLKKYTEKENGDRK